MQAVLFPEPETITITEVDDPMCAADEVIVQVAASGICGTDLHIYRNEYMSDFPLIPGHEFAGVIVEVGRGATDFRPGERVAVDPNLYCGHCHFCRNLQANQCLNLAAVGVTRPGAFADYVAVPARACYKVPETLTDGQAAFIEPLSCVVQALNRFPVAPGADVLIFGAGPMGLLLVQALRHYGAARVVAVDKQAGRLALAQTLGADTTLLAGPEQDAVLRELAPYGFPIVVDATGVPAVIENAFAHLKPRGKFLQFGVTPMTADIRLRPYDVFRNDWTIIGSFALCYTFQPTIDWLVNGVIDVSPLISHTLPLADFSHGFAEFAAGRTLKVQVRPGG